ncbi:MAG TPA: CoA transferase [Candidatus Binataceae bacterium]|nr:CoA transferase [Candidatus Binataceae bacterium]
MPALPLDDIRILDLTHYYNGPYGTLLLSYLGAEVIKVEEPRHGDEMRALFRASHDKEISLGFATLNANKRSITLNLKSAEGREIFKRLATTIDVVIENFAFGAMEGFGLGYDVLRKLNPRLIYGTGKGYGLTGPYRDLPAFDPVVQAMSGVLTTTGEAGGPPMKAGPAVVDMLGGVHLAAAVLAAIRSRDRTGVGSMVEVALQDAVIPTLTSHICAYYGLGYRGSLRDGNRAAGAAVVPYNTYPASDGYVLILAADEARWHRLCALMGRPELGDDPRFASLKERARRIDEVDRLIADWTRNYTRDELMDLFKRADVFCGIVKELTEVMTDPHLHERGMLREIDDPRLGPITIWTSPIRLNGEPNNPRSLSPKLGADTESFYRKELGMDAAEVASLRDRGVI